MVQVCRRVTHNGCNESRRYVWKCSCARFVTVFMDDIIIFSKEYGSSRAAPQTSAAGYNYSRIQMQTSEQLLLCSFSCFPGTHRVRVAVDYINRCWSGWVIHYIGAVLQAPH